MIVFFLFFFHIFIASNAFGFIFSFYLRIFYFPLSSSSPPQFLHWFVRDLIWIVFIDLHAKNVNFHHHPEILSNKLQSFWECLRGVMVKAMDCRIVVSEFVLQSCYYVLHFWTNTLGEKYEPPYPSSYGLNSTTTVLLGEWLWH